jgi:ribose 5-phosphate isomerase B
MGCMKIGIGSDGSGFGLKGVVVDHLKASGHEVVDYGPGDGEQPEYSATYARKVAHAIRDGEIERGVLICGTGIGISISANKVRGIRAAVCSEPFTAAHTRENNGSQIIAFGAFVVGPEMAKSIVDAFLGATFKGETDPEFVSRFNKIAAIEDEELAQH